MKQYKAIFIDWDDTIGDFHGAAKLALLEMYDTYHLDSYFASTEEFISLYKPHNQELWDKYSKDLVTKDFLRIDRFLWPLLHGSKVVSATQQSKEGMMGGSNKSFPLGVKGASPIECPEWTFIEQTNLGEALTSLAEQLSEDFLNLTTAHFSLLEGAEELVRYLAAKYPLTVVTNGFVEVQYEKFDKSGLRDCFAHIVLSEEVGYQKPNPRIFEEALRMNGLQAEDVVMIGDSWSSDIQGAINAGIDQIWIGKNKEQGTKSQDTTEQTATYIVQSLSEVMEIL